MPRGYFTLASCLVQQDAISLRFFGRTDMDTTSASDPLPLVLGIWEWDLGQ